MRIRLPATRSPPCLDAGSRGFAMLGSHSERVATSDVGCGGRAALRTLRDHLRGLAVSRHSCTGPSALGASGARRERQRPEARGIPARRAEIAPRPPGAGKLGRVARPRSGAPETPPSRNARPGNVEPSEPDGNRAGPLAPAASDRGKMSKGNHACPSRDSSWTERTGVRKLEAFHALAKRQRFRSRGAKRPRPARAARPPKAASVGGMGAQRPCAGRFRGAALAEAGRSAKRPAKPGVIRRAARVPPCSR